MKLDLNDTTGIKLLADVADAERCWAIYSNQLSVDRPGYAWTMLPLGNTVYDTLCELMELPSEANVPPDMYAAYFKALTVRRDKARSAWHAYIAPKERPAHVN